MAAELDTYLARQGRYVEEELTWGDGTLPLRVRSYVTQDTPPIAFVTSVRALVFRGLDILVVRDAGGTVHLTPGGRCEAGESWEETLRREVLEETGWALERLRRLGFMHFHHLAPMPAGYRYPYPDFVQVIFVAESGEYRFDAREVGGYEIEASFQPLAGLHRLLLSASQKFFLEAALALRGVDLTGQTLTTETT